jgi:hypothetical protein
MSGVACVKLSEATATEFEIDIELRALHHGLDADTFPKL